VSNWKVEVRNVEPGTEPPAILQLALIWDVWRNLTKQGRAALVAAHEGDGWIDAHPLTVAALERHGLVVAVAHRSRIARITEAGTMVATYRPVGS